MDAGATDEGARTRLFRRRTWLAVGGLVVLLLALAVGWPRYAEHLREQVHVQLGVDPHEVEMLECDGTDVVQVDAADIGVPGDAESQGGSGLGRSMPERLVPAFVASPPFECELFFHVANPTPRSVTIERLVWPTFGPESSGNVQAVALNGVEPSKGRAPAVFDVDTRIGPNGQQTFALRLEATEEGCLSEGIRTFYDPPQTSVRTLGLAEARSPSEPQFGMLGSTHCEDQ